MTDSDDEFRVPMMKSLISSDFEFSQHFVTSHKIRSLIVLEEQLMLIH